MDHQIYLLEKIRKKKKFIEKIKEFYDKCKCLCTVDIQESSIFFLENKIKKIEAKINIYETILNNIDYEDDH